MAIIGKPIHRYCKVFSFENFCNVLETLRPLGWAVYGDTFTNAEAFLLLLTISARGFPARVEALRSKLKLSETHYFRNTRDGIASDVDLRSFLKPFVR